ncbi:MAG: esterase [Anaerolineae bacterium]|nr:esterase [Anaerolineae bacterium]
MILPHEHIFANFLTGDDHGIGVSAVVAAMLPEIETLKASGVTALVDATAVGGARRLDILKAVSEAANFPIVAATGIFKEPFKTDWVHRRGEDGLAQWMTGELTGSSDDSGVRAGWIKLSAADEGLTGEEQVLIRAAARASQSTDAAIGSHTVRGRVALDQLDLIERVGAAADRFIWIHTQMENDFDLHLEVARRGAWIEYDAIDETRADDEYITWIRRLIDAGLHDRLLLSQDRGGYNPAQPGGGVRKPYTYLGDTFLPRLREAGIEAAIVHQLTSVNPFHAYAVGPSVTPS